MAEYEFSSITVDQLKALEQSIYTDLLNRGLRTYYMVGGRSFSFATIDAAQNFLKFLQAEIAKRTSGGGFTLVQMAEI